MTIKRIIGSSKVLAVLVTVSACVDDTGEDVSFERLDETNNPAFVDENFQYKVTDLPVNGKAARSPTPASRWATYEDSINYLWDGAGSLSPAAKYGQAFGVDGLEDRVSGQHGIDLYKGGRQSCQSTSDCADLDDGSSCAKRRGAEMQEGVCIPSWWGIGHGWAAYAISEPAALTPVEYHGVTFYPGDIEALMSLVYSQGLRVKVLRERCEEKTPEMVHDGRIVEGVCRDLNPATLHLVASNMIGLRKISFVEDRTIDLQLGMQPVNAYRVTNAENGRLREVTKDEALVLLGLPEGSDYSYNEEAKRFFHVKLDLDSIVEAPAAKQSHVGDPGYIRTDSYEYILETDSGGNIFGGEYIADSRAHHPDFVWWPIAEGSPTTAPWLRPTATPTGWIAEGKITYDNVTFLNEMATEVQ